MATIDIGPYRYSGTDAAKTFHLLGDLWDLRCAGRDVTLVDGVAAELTARLSSALGTDADATADVSTRLTALGDAVARGPLVNDPVLLADVVAALCETDRIFRAAGQVSTTAQGTVTRLSKGSGGVPKQAADEVEVGWGGVVGDVQASRAHHGRPWQALCIWSQEVIDAFAAAGHPIFAGAAGENVTVTGLPWSDVRAGVDLAIGDVRCTVWAYALPCFQNKPWFSDGDFTHMHHERGPVSRVYAMVTRPGRISTGDPVILEPTES